MKAKKDNKVYQIDERQKKRYLAEGFDIYDDEGRITEHSPLKKIRYSDHLKYIEVLSAQIKELEESKPDTKELKALKKENENLKKSLESLQIENEELKKALEAPPKEGE